MKNPPNGSVNIRGKNTTSAPPDVKKPLKKTRKNTSRIKNRDLGRFLINIYNKGADQMGLVDDLTKKAAKELEKEMKHKGKHKKHKSHKKHEGSKELEKMAKKELKKMFKI